MTDSAYDDGERKPYVTIDVPVDDRINHPKHYTSHPSGVECIEIVEHMSFNLGNAVKYVWRAGLKTEKGAYLIEDLRKARWYIDREIARLGEKP